MTDHISKQFDQDLETIRSRMMQMGGLVESQAHARPALREETRPQADRGEPQGATTEGGKGQRGQRGKLELSGEGPGLELNRGEDQDPGQPAPGPAPPSPAPCARARPSSCSRPRCPCR